jgi:hypothetical protein
MQLNPDIPPPSLSTHECLRKGIPDFIVFRVTAILDIAPLSIYHPSRYIATNCGKQTVALYRELTLCIFLQVTSEFHFINRVFHFD